MPLIVSQPSSDTPRARRRGGPSSLLALVLLVFMVGACDVVGQVLPVSTGTVIDGFAVGPVRLGGCTGTGERNCGHWEEMARTELDGLEPEHAPVSGAELHDYDYNNTDVFPDGMPIVGSGPFMIALLRLEDGTVRALGIDCGVSGCGATDDPAFGAPERVGICEPDRTRWNQCEQILAVARAELDRADPGHPEIADTSLDRDNGEASYTIDFGLTDSTTRSIGVDCTPEGCTAVALP
jgi:hypothetical protein